MSLSRWFTGLCVLCLSASFAVAQEKKDPLRFVPSEAEIVVTVDRTADLVNSIEKNPLFKDAQKLAGVREAYDTTTFLQFYQLLAHFEKQLGLSREELVEQVTARVVFAARFTDKNKGAMAVIQAKDAKTLRRFLDVAFDVLQQELDRQESKDKVVRKKYAGFETGQIGSNLSFAIADRELIFASDEKILKAALDVSLGKGEHKSVLTLANFTDARKAAPPKALASAWIHLDEIRKFQNFKDGLNAASLDPLQVLLFGGLTDLLKRSPYVTASLLRESDTLHRVTIQMPRGREGMSALSHMILPASGKGVLPPLMPARVLSTTSYHLDLGQYWDKRVDILGEKNAKGLEEGNQNLAKFLGGIKLEKLFHAAGANQRLVFAQQKETPYKVKPGAPFPAVALVVDMRDPSFARDMNTILRSAALLATFSVGLSLKEETYKDCELVSYHFNEKKKVEFDPTNIRFNFTPTYVTCGDQFIMSGTAELAKDLIDAIKSEKRDSSSTASMRSEAFASGFVNLARSNQDLLMTQLMLAQALPPNTAKKEVEAIFNYLDRLGSLRVEMNYGANDFRYDIIWQAK